MLLFVQAERARSSASSSTRARALPPALGGRWEPLEPLEPLERRSRRSRSEPAGPHMQSSRLMKFEGRALRNDTRPAGGQGGAQDGAAAAYQFVSIWPAVAVATGAAT